MRFKFQVLARFVRLIQISTVLAELKSYMQDISFQVNNQFLSLANYEKTAYDGCTSTRKFLYLIYKYIQFDLVMHGFSLV